MNAKIKAAIATLICSALFCIGFLAGHSTGYHAGTTELLAERSRGDTLQRTIDSFTRTGSGDLRAVIEYQRSIDDLQSSHDSIGRDVLGAEQGVGDILRILDELERRENKVGR